MVAGGGGGGGERERGGECAQYNNFTHTLYRGYYTVVRRYEFYLRVVKTIVLRMTERIRE